MVFLNSICKVAQLLYQQEYASDSEILKNLPFEPDSRFNKIKNQV